MFLSASMFCYVRITTGGAVFVHFFLKDNFWIDLQTNQERQCESNEYTQRQIIEIAREIIGIGTAKLTDYKHTDGAGGGEDIQ